MHDTSLRDPLQERFQQELLRDLKTHVARDSESAPRGFIERILGRTEAKQRFGRRAPTRWAVLS